jgi:frataxin-like iron-binding protein CyaY
MFNKKTNKEFIKNIDDMYNDFFKKFADKSEEISIAYQAFNNIITTVFKNIKDENQRKETLNKLILCSIFTGFIEYMEQFESMKDVSIH